MRSIERNGRVQDDPRGETDYKRRYIFLLLFIQDMILMGLVVFWYIQFLEATWSFAQGLSLAVAVYFSTLSLIAIIVTGKYLLRKAGSDTLRLWGIIGIMATLYPISSLMNILQRPEDWMYLMNSLVVLGPSIPFLLTSIMIILFTRNEGVTVTW